MNHQKIEGYMDDVTMRYKVDKPDVFKKVKVGDQIRATVYDGDYTLYDVEVLWPAGNFEFVGFATSSPKRECHEYPDRLSRLLTISRLSLSQQSGLNPKRRL